jgi:hypothetical protein
MTQNTIIVSENMQRETSEMQSNSLVSRARQSEGQNQLVGATMCAKSAHPESHPAPFLGTWAGMPFVMYGFLHDSGMFA